MTRDKITLSQLESFLFKSADITEDGVKYHLNRLKTDGVIRRIGPDKGGHWEVVE
jgi:ATP-dependent DNA helicase RecG